MRTLQSLSLPLAQAARCPAAPSKLGCWSANHRAQAHLARLAGKVFARCTLPRRALHLAKRCVASIVALLPLSSRSPRSCPAARHFTGQRHHYIIKFAYLRLASSWYEVRPRAFRLQQPSSPSRHPLRLPSVAVLRIMAPAGAGCRSTGPPGAARPSVSLLCKGVTRGGPAQARGPCRGRACPSLSARRRSANAQKVS